MTDIDLDLSFGGPEFVAELYQSKRPFGRQKWRFRIVAKNGQVVATSEAYVNRSDAEDIARRLAGTVKAPPGNH